MAKRSEMSDQEFGERLVRCFDAVAELHANGARDEDAPHPMRVVNDWIAEVKGARAGNVGEAKEIEPNANDNPPPTAGTPAPPTEDAALVELAIRQRGSAGMDGELWAARAARINPRAVRAMSRSIPGYDRLR